MKIAIVDDEQSQRDILKSYLDRFSKENEIPLEVELFDDPEAFLCSFNDSYSLLLLDIEMPQMTGLELAKKIREKGSGVGIIFVTVMAQYAINGYEVNALDFMVKPVNYFPFSVKLLKVIRTIPSKKNFIVRSEGETIIIGENEILYIEGSNQYVIYHLRNKKQIKVKSTLKDAEEKISKTKFARCNNSFIVNLDFANKVSGNNLYIGNDILPISRSKKKEFLERINRNFGGI